jgi:predicted amidohydrolase YtcJ
MCELLWSDPQAELGRSPSKRGVGVAFGAQSDPLIPCTGMHAAVCRHTQREHFMGTAFPRCLQART